MDIDLILRLLREALLLALLLSGPAVLAAMVVGLVVSVFQAATQLAGADAHGRAEDCRGVPGDWDRRPLDGARIGWLRDACAGDHSSGAVAEDEGRTDHAASTI